MKLPCGGIFDDKLSSPPVSKVVPHVQFSKEYFLDLHFEVRKHGTYNYARAKMKIQHSKLNIEMFLVDNCLDHCLIITVNYNSTSSPQMPPQPDCQDTAPKFLQLDGELGITKIIWKTPAIIFLGISILTATTHGTGISKDTTDDSIRDDEFNFIEHSN